MTKSPFLLCLLLFASVVTWSQTNYAVTAIPEKLLKDAHVIKRFDEQSFEVVSLDKAIYRKKFALTILNESGQDYAGIVVGYDRLRKVNSIDGVLYDGAGNVIRKVKSKEINDYSATGSVNLYDDNRVKVHDFNHKSFPYTVEYEMEVEYKHTFYFPDWIPQSHERLSVEKSSFTFIAPESYTVRYKALNFPDAPTTSTEKGKKRMTWQAQGLAALIKPYASPSWSELTPSVLFAPTEFEMEGYKGNASSWQEFGKFILALNKDRDKLPDAVTQKVQALTAGLTNTKEKVLKLYEYLQQNTRYISIQLGIGGFQPFEATYVAQKGYGDCKALSNYMYSLLKVAGIPSYHALINSGKSLDAKQLVEDLPSTQFNHMVLFVPIEKDTMWLECTSQDNPGGYAGGFTGNRKALAITPDGGKLVNTPNYKSADNRQIRFVKGIVDDEGRLQVAVTTKYAALQQDYYSDLITALSKEKVKKILNEELDFSTYEVGEFAYKAKKQEMPEIDEELKIVVENYATISGKRLFLIPNVMNRSGRKVQVDEARKVDYVFDYPYYDEDSVEITIPQGYQIEAVQPPVVLKTKYGKYLSRVKIEGSKITYYRMMEQFGGRYPASEGNAIAEFYNTIHKADRTRLVLVKTEGEKPKSATP